MWSRIVVISILAFGLASCSSRGAGKGDKELGGLSEAELAAQRESRFGSGGIPTAEGEGIFRDIHFDYDSSRIDDTARQNIEYNVEVLKSYPELNLVLEGHCDSRGTAEYNLALGEARGVSVKDILLSYGIPGSRLKTISYGEELPLDPGQDEYAFAKNRRVHFSPFQ